MDGNTSSLSPVSQILERINQDTLTTTATRKTSALKGRKVNRTPSKQIQINVSPISPPITPRTEQSFNEMWDVIEKCILFIFQNQKSSLFEPAFQEIQKISNKQDLMKQLNSKYNEIITKFAFENIQKMQQISVANELIAHVKHIKEIVQILESLFAPFERAYFFPSLTILTSIQQHFVEQFNKNDEFREKVLECLRIGYKTNRAEFFEDKENHTDFTIFAELADTTQFLCLEDLLLPKLITDSTQFFSELSQKANRENVETYLHWIEKQVDTEYKITLSLKVTTSIQLLENCRQHLYGIQFSMEIMPTIEEIFRISKYKLFVDLIALTKYSESLLLFVKEEIKNYAKGRAKLSLTFDDDKCISFLFNESKILHEVINETNLPIFKQALKSFSSAMNTAAFKCEFLFAKFVDSAIRNTPFTDVQDYVDFFRNISRIDEFIEHNRQFLVNRILELGSATFPKEVTFVSMMRELVGPTEGIEKSTTMIEDAEESERLNFKPKKLPGRIILVTYEAWPEYPPLNITVPTEIAEEREVFATEFRASNPNKKIKMWVDYLEDVEFASSDGRIRGASSLLHFCRLLELQNGTDSSFDSNDQFLNELKQSGLVDSDGKITDREGSYSVQLPSLRIPAKRKEEAEIEMRRIRSQRILSTLVRVAKKLKTATKMEIMSAMREEIADLTDDELEEQINISVSRDYLSREDDTVSFVV